MKKNKLTICIVALATITACITVACGGNSSQTVQSTDTQQTDATSMAAETVTETQAEESTEYIGDTTLNYDVVDALDEDFDGIVSLIGTPTSDSGESTDVRTLLIADREYLLYNDITDDHDMTCFEINTKVDDLFILPKDNMTKDEFLSTLDAENVDDSSKDSVVFDYEGYKISLAIDADGRIPKGSAASISTLVE